MKKQIKFALISLLISWHFGIPETSYCGQSLTQKVFTGYELAQDWDLISAEKLSDTLLKEHPESGDVHFLRARIEFLKGNYEHSWKILQKVSGNFKEIADFK